MSLPTSFDAPERLLLLLVVAGLVGAYALEQLRRRSRRRAWTSDALLASSAPRRPGPTRHLSPALLALSLVAMTTAFAGPRAEQEVSRERATVVVALDASTSMLAQDVTPDRWTAAKAAATSFVRELPAGFEVGLVSFNATAALQVTPTRDHEAVVRAIDGLELRGGTALGDAVRMSVDALAAPGEEPVGAVVLLADGGSTTGSPLPAVLARAAEAGVPVSTIAYGTEEGAVVLGGRVFRVPVDEQVLADIADATGGRAYTARSGAQLAEVYDGIRTRLASSREQVDVSAGLAGLALALLVGAAAPALLRR